MTQRYLSQPEAPLAATKESRPAAGLSAEPLPAGMLPLEAGLARLREGDWVGAAACFRAALGREPGRFAAVRGLATAYLQLKDVPAARDLLERYTRDHPVTAEGWRLAAQLEWKAGNRRAAVGVLRRGLARLPHSALLHRQLALALAACGQYADAAPHAEDAGLGADHDPLADYLTAAAGAMRRPGRMVAALDAGGGPADAGVTPVAATRRQARDDDWLDRIAADPALLDAVVRLHEGTPAERPLADADRQILLDLEWKAARLLESQPHHADRQVLLAKLQLRVDAVASALLSLQRAARANPHLVEAQRLRARLHVYVGEVDAALSLLRDLVRRGTAWPDVHLEIAALERQHGRVAAAEQHLRRAIQINPQFQRARHLLDEVTAKAA